MIGQKGMPARHGGVERHVEELGARLVERGHEVVVFTRPNYSDPEIRNHRGMQLVSLPTIGTKHLDAIVHSTLCSAAVWGGHYDIVHYHAIGPCIASPLARIRGRRVVATIHGQDWRRGKWSPLASSILRLAERAALTVPHATIAVSESLTRDYLARGRGVTYIPNGVTIDAGDDVGVLDELGVRDGEYILFAGRLVPEKGAHYLVQAHERAGVGLPLVIAGGSSLSDEYTDRLKRQASTAVFAGYRYGPELAALFRHAALFVLPSDLEGLPIVLLEALAYGTPVLASDIPPNVEVLGEQGRYFSAGDVQSLSEALAEACGDIACLRSAACELREIALAEYDWDHVAAQTEQLYSRVAGESVRQRSNQSGPRHIDEGRSVGLEARSASGHGALDDEGVDRDVGA
jgi:glycosyltransferase involved in cell wall biosynthesis